MAARGLRPDASIRGAAAMIAGAGLLTLNDAVSKYLTERYPLGQVIALRQAAFLVIVPCAWSVTGLAALRPVNLSGQIFRGLLFVAGTGLILLSLSLLPLSFVTIVLFSGPLFVACSPRRCWASASTPGSGSRSRRGSRASH